MMSALSASMPRPAASTDAPLSLAELGGAILAGLVPMPAESSGYLLLGIADQMAKAPLPLDPRCILLSSEGNLSMLVLTTTSRSANVEEGLLEGQLRRLLARLLAHAPGHAPALTAVSRRSPQGGLLALIRELEAALIPVNRAAGRRALARLQREVEGVRRRIPAPLTLEAPRKAAPAPSPVVSAPPPPQEPQVAPRKIIATVSPSQVAPIPSLFPPRTQPALSPDRTEAQCVPPVHQEEEGAHTELRAPIVMEIPYTSPQEPEPSMAPLEVVWNEPEPAPPASAFKGEESAGTRAPTIPLTRGTRPATVEQLLADFAPSDGLSEREVNRKLKQAVGLELSALPPGVETFAPPVVQDTSLWQPAPEVVPVKAPSPPPFEPRPARNPRASLAVTFVLLLLGLAATAALWIRFPGFFSGHGP